MRTREGGLGSEGLEGGGCIENSASVVLKRPEMPPRTGGKSPLLLPFPSFSCGFWTICLFRKSREKKGNGISLCKFFLSSSLSLFFVTHSRLSDINMPFAAIKTRQPPNLCLTEKAFLRLQRFWALMQQPSQQLAAAERVFYLYVYFLLSGSKAEERRRSCRTSICCFSFFRGG